MRMRIAGLAIGCLATALLGYGWAGAAHDEPLAEDAWHHEGDADGDGLSDAFETAHGLDPAKADTFGDGTPDESRVDASGKTMFEMQAAEQNPSAAGEVGGGGGGCGALGMEVACFWLVLGFLRRRAGNRLLA